MNYKINSVELMISVPTSVGSYDDAKKELEEEMKDPDFGDGLGYALIKSYILDEIDSDDETDGEYLFRVVFIY